MNKFKTPSRIAATLEKAESISSYIEVLTDEKFIGKIEMAVKEADMGAVNRRQLMSGLDTLVYLRKSFESETKGKALSTMAAKHKDLVIEMLSLIFPDKGGSNYKTTYELYVLLSEMLNLIAVNKEPKVMPEVESKADET